ncbi:uncharacterized protein LOC125195136 [Salvia hispanica]|uniref:uncharacterized protein LOC125195136 n=1 Tax=Salvia hispanica TaxID=49212 RepID=UPI0020095279|nr:uncharacterized protein LOC125195136 [Salvia hispanica]
MGDAGGSSVGGSGGEAEEFSRRFNEELTAYMSREINRLIQRALQPQQPAVPRSIVHRRGLVDRDHVVAYQRLYEDYFAPDLWFGANLFGRRFRMRGSLFMRIVDTLERRYMCFRFRHDAAGRPGHTPIQKCTAAIRQLTYGGAADMWDEYLHIGETTSLLWLKFFCQGFIEIFGEQYLRSPTPEDCQDLKQMYGERDS